MAQGVNGDRLEDQMKVDRPSDQLLPREVKILAISPLKMKCTHTPTPPTNSVSCSTSFSVDSGSLSYFQVPTKSRAM